MSFLDRFKTKSSQKNAALIYSPEKKPVPVRLEHVSKIYEDPKTHRHFYAVKDSNIVIQPGEFVTLLGPSGCGKTTTLRRIAGFESPDEGQVYIGDIPVNALTPNQRDTAMVFHSSLIKSQMVYIFPPPFLGVLLVDATAACVLILFSCVFVLPYALIIVS